MLYFLAGEQTEIRSTVNNVSRAFMEQCEADTKRGHMTVILQRSSTAVIDECDINTEMIGTV